MKIEKQVNIRKTHCESDGKNQKDVVRIRLGTLKNKSPSILDNLGLVIFF